MNTVYRQSPMREAGYTQIDNKIFDAQPFLSPAAFGVLLRMVRMIDGYGNTDKSLSNSFLQETCNISKNTVSKVVNELVDFGF
nr:replication protein [Psychrobacter sp. PraFG1]UNK04381.1 replication protein [Psychrobacter sp. PraFG1]